MSIASKTYSANERFTTSIESKIPDGYIPKSVMFLKGSGNEVRFLVSITSVTLVVYHVYTQETTTALTVRVFYQKD